MDARRVVNHILQGANPTEAVGAALGEESDAAKKAKSLGLVHKGFGNYADPSTGKVTHRSRGGKLEPVKGAGTPSGPPDGGEENGGGLNIPPIDPEDEDTIEAFAFHFFDDDDVAALSEFVKANPTEDELRNFIVNDIYLDPELDPNGPQISAVVDEIVGEQPESTPPTPEGEPTGQMRTVTAENDPTGVIGTVVELDPFDPDRTGELVEFDEDPSTGEVLSATIRYPDGEEELLTLGDDELDAVQDALADAEGT